MKIATTRLEPPRENRVLTNRPVANVPFGGWGPRLG